MVGLISCDTLSHIFLQVLVEERVVVLVEAGRSEEIRHIGDGFFSGSHNHAAGEIYLCVHIKFNNLTYRGSPIHLQHYRALVLTGRRIRLVTLPVQRVDADGTRQNNLVIGILLYVLGTLGVIADDDTCIALSLGELQEYN